jgi:mannosyl-oligosaccharide glucosidase
VWQAKSEYDSTEVAWATTEFVPADPIMNAYMANVQTLVDQYKEQSPPDPAVLFALPNEVRYGANLFAFQKTYEGEWSVDVYYDSGSVASKLDRPFSFPYR